jgi:hypothetical protein
VLLLLILGFVVIIAVEVPTMVLKEQKGELRAFWVLLAVGFGLSLAVVQGWPVPSPTKALEAVFKPFAMLMGLK